MSSSRTTSILTVAGLSVVGILAYAAYFDYKRRTDVEFRKKIRKDKKRVEKNVAAESKESLAASTAAAAPITPEVLREALQQVKNEEGPTTPEEKETYFMSQVGMGEQLAAQGPEAYLPSAMCFFRALRVYPSPVELIVIYQKTVPAPIFQIVMDMTNLDVKARVEGYYDHFPPKSSNVSVETLGSRKILVVNKDFKAGDVIYKEFPVVTALDPDVQAAGTNCAHCFRAIQEPMSLQLPAESNPLSSVFCSKACLVANKTQSHSLLFTTDSPLPAEIPSAPVSDAAQAARRQAQADFVAYLKEEGRGGPLLVARFIARQVEIETGKMVHSATGRTGGHSEGDFTDADAGEYLLADHLERLRYLEVVPNPKELPLLVSVLQNALPGLEQFITDERHAMLLGKMAYNAYGVCFGGGRDNRPVPTVRPEEVEKTRTPYGTARQIGSALYTVSSYLNHSCRPSARPSFSTGTAEFHLIANRDLKAGDELTVAFVDVFQDANESVVECRRRRRIELARGWRFPCLCERCEEEAREMTVEEKGGAVEEKDESKVEETMRRFEENEAGVVSLGGGEVDE